ncbi:NADH-quinone oxidoreductase subunit C/D [compost metagenome]
MTCGWDKLVQEFVAWLPKRLDEYEKGALHNSILRGCTIGVAAYNSAQALAAICGESVMGRPPGRKIDL